MPEDLEPPPLAYEQEAVEGQRPMFPEWYLGELVASYGCWLEDAHGHPAHLVRALSDLTDFMRKKVHPDQRFELGRRVLLNVVGEEVTQDAINRWLTGITNNIGRPRARIIRGLTGYILGTARDEPDAAAATPDADPPVPPQTLELPPSPPPADEIEQTQRLITVMERLSSGDVLRMIAVFASVGEEYTKVFIEHFTHRGSVAGGIAVRRAAPELSRMLDQYHAQVPDELRSDKRYEVIRKFVQKLIGYDGRLPSPINEVLRRSRYSSTPSQMRAAFHHITSMLREMLRCEIMRDPENMAKFLDQHAG